MSNVHQYFVAIVLAILLVLFIGLFNNVMAPLWDGLCYIDMAKNGILKNNSLEAPFAYRPGMPFLSRLAADLFSVSIERGFQMVGWVASVLLLFFSFTLAKFISTDFMTSILTIIIVSLMGIHIKAPLFFYSLIDIAAYAFIVVAIWALLKKYYWLCLSISSIGLFFKEFLAIPLLLLIYRLIKEHLKTKSKKTIVLLMLVVLIGMIFIVAPRLFIKVKGTEQEIDPFNDLGSIKKVFSIPFNGARNVNILYAMVSYWLPSLLLINVKRIRHVWIELKDLRTFFYIYFVIIAIFIMYGGTNIMIFVSYMLPLQIIVLTILLKQNVHWLEVVYLVFVLILFNKIFLQFPLPQVNFGEYIDFYGGWGSRINYSTIRRFIEIAVFAFIAQQIRWGIETVTAKHAIKK